MTSITGRIAAFVADTTYDSLPDDVTARAKSLVMDGIGIAVRARHDADSTPSMLAAVARLGLGTGPNTVFSDSATYSPPGAAMINGALIHSLDFDDTHAGGSIHTGAPIIPAALAAAEMAGADGRALIAGIVAGFELQIRLSLALGPRDHYERGFHPTATCGAFGAAAAAANIFGLPAAQVSHALGICLSQTSGSLAFLNEGAWTKRFQVGYAAMNGLIAASLAREGYTGPAEPFTGKSGFLKAYAPNPDADKAVAGLGEVYETLEIGVKPYPSCRYGHAGMDALIALRDEHAIALEEIEAVEVGLSHTGWHIVGEPESDKHAPKNTVDGQFSMPFLGAVALREGGMVWDDYQTHLADEQTMALCRKISTTVAPDSALASPWSAVAELRTGRGTFKHTVAVPKGEPETFPTDAELRAKFDGLVAPYLSSERRDAAASALLAIDAAAEVSAVMQLTRSDHAVPLRVAAGEN